jgi:mono/diheme cytochrome c family protein
MVARAAGGALLAVLTVATPGHADPAPGDAEAIAAGRRLYRTRCYICHLGEGGRGPNLFESRLTEEQFVEVVINGRKGTQMPAFGLRMGPDEARQVHAFVRSTDHYE